MDIRSKVVTNYFVLKCFVRLIYLEELLKILFYFLLSVWSKVNAVIADSFLSYCDEVFANFEIWLAPWAYAYNFNYSSRLFKPVAGQSSTVYSTKHYGTLYGSAFRKIEI